MKATRSGIAKALGTITVAAALLIAVGCSGSAGTTGGATGGGSSTGKGPVERGQEVFKSAKTGCSNCHKINGQGGTVGPDLSKIGTVAAQRKPGMPAAGYIQESIQNPGAFVVDGYQNMMGKANLSDGELNDLVAYLASLK